MSVPAAPSKKLPSSISLFDENADQEMSDAVTIAKVTDSDGNALDKTEILSSELDYFSTLA